jgi:hypothetical protein
MKPVVVRMLAVGIIGLGLGYGLLRADNPPPNPRNEAQTDIIRLSENLDAADVKDRAKQIVEKHDSCDISSIFKLGPRIGPGIGKLKELGFRDSIDALTAALSTRKTTTEAEIEKYQPEFLRVAKILQAMAELAPYRGKIVVANYEKRAKEWEKVAADFKQKTAEFRKSIEEKDPKRLRLAAESLRGTCNDCHNIAF